jgi:hypothetical protein
MTPDPGEVTQLLQHWRTGDPQVEARLFNLLMPDLHQIAERCFRRERPGNTLQPTTLVNEAFLRLAFFLGLTDQETADALDITLHTMQREWYHARRWLFERLTGEP